MARVTQLAFLALALIQVVLAFPFGKGLMIINLAANGTLRGYPDKAPIVERNIIEGDNNVWAIVEFGDGVMLYMPRASAHLNLDDDGNVIVRGGPIKWNFHYAGSGLYNIVLPYKNVLLEWNEENEKVSLQSYNGRSSQLSRVERVGGYSRMFSQY